MSKHFARQPDGCVTIPLLLLGALACAGCGSTDGSRLLQPGGGYGGLDSGGTAGGGSGGAAGTGGSGGSATEPRDAGPDAAGDASSSCVVGPLERYCALGAGYCPATYAEARAKAREPVFALRSLLILQQACTAPDGSARIRVSAVYASMSRSYIFDPMGGRLVSVQLYDDLGGCTDGDPGSGFGTLRGFYGEDLPGCSFGYADVQVPAECNVPTDWRTQPEDAGAPRDAGADAGTGPYECILAP